MVYKYQIETIEQLEDVIDKLENMTEKFYRIHIGYRHTNNFDEWNIPIFMEINGNHMFSQRTNLDDCYDNYSRCELRNYNRITFNKDIFLDINKLIDRIISDNKKRKEFHIRLNEELKALNKVVIQ